MFHRSLLLKSSPLESEHSDVYQVAELCFGEGNIVTSVDDGTRKVWVYPIGSKDEVLYKLIENQSCMALEIMVGNMCQRPFRYSDSEVIKREL